MPPKRQTLNDPLDILNARLNKLEAQVCALQNEKINTVPVYDSTNVPTNSIENQIAIHLVPATGISGYVVAISRDGSTIVIGDPDESNFGTNGTVYVYSAPNFNTPVILTASDGVTADHFGNSVAVSDDGSIIAVGAWQEHPTPGIGKAYIYSDTDWTTETIITPSDGVLGDHFGSSVALSGDGSLLAVGAIYATFGSIIALGPFSPASGAVYVYSGASWASEQRIDSSFTTDVQNFGESVSFSQDGLVLAVGAPNYSVAEDERGRVYVYSGTSYVTETIVDPAVPTTNDLFGTTVALSDDASVLAVGGQRSGSISPSGNGVAFVRTNTDWTDEQILTASDGIHSDYFGLNVAIMPDGTSILVGAPSANGFASGSGAVYIYNGSAYSVETKIALFGSESGDNFGSSVAIHNLDLIAVGAKLAPVSGDGLGRAYVNPS